MSMTVYPAYRLRRESDLWPLVQDIRIKAEAKIKEVLWNLYFNAAEVVDKESEEYKRRARCYTNPNLDLAGLSIAHDKIRTAFKTQATSLLRNDYDFSVSVHFRKYDGRIYATSYCDMEMREVLKFLKKDKRLRDFSYWNGNDTRPKGVTARAWAERRRIWNGMVQGIKLDRNVLKLEICSPDNFESVDPYYDEEYRKRYGVADPVCPPKQNNQP